MTAPRHRLTPVERLARDICWADDGQDAVYIARVDTLGDAASGVITKAQYWANLPDQARDVYTDEAERFTWLVRKLGAPTIAKILAET